MSEVIPWKKNGKKTSEKKKKNGKKKNGNYSNSQLALIILFCSKFFPIAYEWKRLKL
jgi:hypothetical protein